MRLAGRHEILHKQRLQSYYARGVAIQLVWLNGTTYQRTRRERPMCRSAPVRTELLPIKPDMSPTFVIPTVALAEWRNPPRGRMNHQKDKTCCLGRFLGSLPFARNDITGERSTSAPIVPTMFNAVPPLIHRLRAVPLPRWGRFFGAFLGRSLHTLPDGSK